MGIRSYDLEHLKEHLKNISKNLLDVRMLELGGQKIRWAGPNYPNTSKEYFESLGIEHITIDFNLRHHNVIPVDLNKPIEIGQITPLSKIRKRKWIVPVYSEDGSVLTTKFEPFHIVTDFGTGEHVDNQYCFFKNCHTLCKENGIMVHKLPLIGHWEGHCNYHYSQDFFEKLSNKCSYSILDIQIIPKKIKNNSIKISLKKSNNNPFVSEKEFNDFGIYGWPRK